MPLATRTSISWSLKEAHTHASQSTQEEWFRTVFISLFPHTPMPDSNIDQLLQKAIDAFKQLTPEEQNEHRRQQYISFTLGQLQLSGREDVTPEQISKILDELQEAGVVDYREHKPLPKTALERILETDEWTSS